MAAVAELEHFCGRNSRYFNTVRYHPSQPETLIYTAAATIIIEDVNDPHKQEFLRGHDADISALDISLNGKLLASGQVGAPGRKGAVAGVIVWDFERRERYIEFGGLAHSVLCLSFAPDGRFLVGSGANQMIYVWDVSSGEVVYSRKTESPCVLALWGPYMEPAPGSRYPSYMLCTAYDNQILKHHMEFDIGSMSYALGSEAIQFPSSGLQRKHICGMVNGDFLMTGTAAGDLCIFSLKTNVFRTSMPICNNGVTSVTRIGELVYVAGGDGRIKAIRGHDTHWDVLAENILEVGIMALTPSADGAELVAGTRNGKLYRLLTSDLTAAVQSVTHTDKVTDVAFGASSDVVCTCSEAGEVFVVDLSDYMPVMTATCKSPARAVAMAASGQEVIAGYDDGFIRGWSPRGESQLIWQVQAHRGGVTTLRESPDYIASGGADAAVRFWRRGSRELLSSFSSHRKPVSDIILDRAMPHLVHSGSEDKLVVTYDLKMNKSLVTHTTQTGSVTGLSQRRDHEQEVVSCSLDGKLLFWDVDYANPTGALDAPPGPAAVRFRCCEVSPSGRYIAAGAEDSRLFVFDLVTCACIQESSAHSAEVTKVRWSPDQKQIVSCGKDGCVVIWNFFEP
mmetsp:Transcript_67179/g.160907  ORF Transcript_67179/g.160907 Transcript_67179/m.160907 type:complete len:622 (+) Transcript_67179:88-1953(+)